MDKITIKTVQNNKMLNQFINLPKKIYKNDPLWIPPIWLFEHLDYKKAMNSVLSRSEHNLFLAFCNNTVVGRIIVYIDPRYNSFHKSSMGFFGAFESDKNPDIASALFDKADKWFREHGVNTIRGPIDPVAECWGFELTGSIPPIYMSIHNPPYYNDFAEYSGFIKAKDLLVYEADAKLGYKIPQRFISFADKILLRNKNITVRPINKKNLKNEADSILHILNKSVSGNWGFVPVEKDEMLVLFAKLKLIIDCDVIWFVEDDGIPVGCTLGFPDINVIIKKNKGRLFPLGIFRFLFGLKKIRDFRLWGLALLPEYHGKGLDVLLYIKLFQALEPRGVRLEANYVLEDNRKIVNALEKMELTKVKSYGVYEKQITPL